MRCKRQVFTNEETALRTANLLRHFEIYAHPFRCPDCRWVHLIWLKKREHDIEVTLDDVPLENTHLSR